ncbi:Type I phosphodiesterase/nucleotide pyrophosphatase/phosphate transferase [Moorella glycerini]|uniref:Type I phosphodiesterase / nucleotide pyrophosphatase n=1 Tax=Neomoorella stamsii TaxID=1266720 RepID=A0A9X7J5V5_9FIRM|nr:MULTISPECIES: alkaline phosphatase family protein [Moorella]PRR76101.1 Type I phosphodiesterase / nucleotide pyrophosphatase [Moorella stamsii]CEP68293.1 Type I phosphodiesterase/nucleotide pyrophosphatase/phosphate transferase [Moorella glycerini]
MNSAKAKKVIMVGIDGADPVFMKSLLDAGKLPNFKRVLEMGVTTEDMSMMGALPTITPPNWASLATGAWPGTHGITCFWNHTLGNPLDQMDYGFNSQLCKAEFIWDAYARAGKKCIVFYYPTAWPPTNSNTIYVDGSRIYPNMAAYCDYEKIYQCKEGDFPIKEILHEANTSGRDCIVEGEITSKKFEVEDIGEVHRSESKIVTNRYDGELAVQAPSVDVVITPIKPAEGWKKAPDGAKEVVLPVNSGMARRYGLIIAEDGHTYNKLQIYTNKQAEEPIGEARVGEWSQFIYDTYTIDGNRVPVAYRIKVISLAPDGSEMEVEYSQALNLKYDKYFYPKEIGPELYKKVGPMHYPSNCPRTEKSKNLMMLESHQEMYKWCADALHYLMDNKEWDLVYCHMHAIDFANHYYINDTLPENSPDHEFYRDLLVKYYEMTDDFIGSMLKRLDGDTTLVITSDHAGVAKNPNCEEPLLGDPAGINVGVMQELGYTKLKEVNGKLEIDWDNTTAISQRSSYIYVNLKGRDPHGIVDPQDYDKLVKKIIDDLYSYRDPKTGMRVVSFALNRDDMQVVGLGGPNCGDIFYILEPDFTRVHGTGLSNHTINGYSLKCLFMMAGAGVKKGEIIKRKVRIVDIVPTICYLQGAPMPRDVEGGVIYQALEE